MSEVQAIRDRLTRAHADPLTFAQHAASDMHYLFALLDALADEVVAESRQRRVSFDVRNITLDFEGYPCLKGARQRAN